MLSFDTLRLANTLRLPTITNSKGVVVHPDSDGSDWPLSKWVCALVGELGEAANMIKKVERGDIGLDDEIEYKGTMITVRVYLAKEYADIVCYTDIIAHVTKVDLGDAVIDKFNEVSARTGNPVGLTPDDTVVLGNDGSYKTMYRSDGKKIYG